MRGGALKVRGEKEKEAQKGKTVKWPFDTTAERRSAWSGQYLGGRFPCSDDLCCGAPPTDAVRQINRLEAELLDADFCVFSNEVWA